MQNTKILLSPLRSEIERFRRNFQPTPTDIKKNPDRRFKFARFFRVQPMARTGYFGKSCLGKKAFDNRAVFGFDIIRCSTRQKQGGVFKFGKVLDINILATLSSMKLFCILFDAVLSADSNKPSFMYIGRTNIKRVQV